MKPPDEAGLLPVMLINLLRPKSETYGWNSLSRRMLEGFMSPWTNFLGLHSCR